MLDPLGNKLRVRVDDLTGVVDQRREVGSRFYKKPRIYADAMPTNARAGAKNLYTRMQVCEGNSFPHIHAKFISKSGEFIRNGNIYIAVSILHQFHHFCCCCVCLDDLTSDASRI